MARRLVVPSVAAVGVVVALCSGLVQARVGPQNLENVSAERIARFHGYTVYSLGSAFAGHRLVARLLGFVPPAYQPSVTRVPPATSPEFVFIYGLCDPPRGAGRCSATVQVQNYAICARNPHSYRQRPRLIIRRGVPVADLGSRLEVYTGRTTVVIFAPRQTALLALRALRGVNAAVRAGARLAQPARGALEGQLRCAP